MSDKIVSFETDGNHWYWRAENARDCQTGTLVTMPEQGRITSVEFKVAGLDYQDPVYGYQYHSGHMRAAVWDATNGRLLTSSGYAVLPPSPGGTQPWVSFNLTDITVAKGQQLIVGFWRDSSTPSYATQWDYNTSDAAGYTTLAQDLFGSGYGPFNFSATGTYTDRSINFRLHYNAGGKVKVWNNGWTVGTAMVWNNGWVQGQVYVWNGTAWEESIE